MKIKDMQNAFYRHTVQRYEMLAPNIYLDWRFNEMDLLGLRKSGYIDEIEIKLTKSDFKADFKKTVKVDGEMKSLFPCGVKYPEIINKPKHDALQEGLNHCNYFSFLIPEELVDKCVIPEYSGLYVYKVDNTGIGRVSEIKKAPLLHKRKISDHFKYCIGRKMAYRYWNNESDIF